MHILLSVDSGGRSSNSSEDYVVIEADASLVQAVATPASTSGDTAPRQVRLLHYRDLIFV